MNEWWTRIPTQIQLQICVITTSPCKFTTYPMKERKVKEVLVTQSSPTHQAPLSMEFSRQEYWSG